MRNDNNDFDKNGTDPLNENEQLRKRICELEQSHFFLETLLNHLPDAIYFKDRKSRFTRVSKALSNRFSKEHPEEIIGKTDFDFQDPEHAKQAFEDEQNIISTNKPLINIVEKEKWNNEVTYVISTKLPLKDGSGKIIGVFGMSRDITNIKNMELTLLEKNNELLSAEEELNQIIEQLQAAQEELIKQKNEIEAQKEKIITQNKELSEHKCNLENLVIERTKELDQAKKKAEESDKLKSAFLANMSHEIRTPMNSIVGFARLMQLPDVSPADILRYIDLINTSADSLMILINDILDLSLIESNQLIIIDKPFKLNQLIQEIYTTMNVTKPNEFVELRLKNEIETIDFTINSDSARIKQIITNLLNNAFKFTKQGYVELGIFLHAESIEFYVADTGMGIPKESLQKIFERFTKLEMSKSDIFKGAGLGLAISKKLAEQLGGRLTVKSEFKKGSKFSFYLPLSKVDQTAITF